MAERSGKRRSTAFVDEDTERYLIAYLLKHPEQLYRMDVTADDFQTEHARGAYEAIVGIHQLGNTPELVGVTEAMTQMGLSDPLGFCMDVEAIEAVDPKAAVRILRTVSLRRLLDSTGRWLKAIASAVEDVDRDEVLKAADRLVAKVTGTTLGEEQPLRKVAEARVEYLRTVAPGTMPGVPTEFPTLDRMLGGLCRKELIVLAARPSMGKAQPLDTPVVTPQGYCPIGDLRVGDPIIGSDGQAQQVVAVHPRGILPVFRVQFSDGTATLACGEHLWWTQTGNERGFLKTTAEIRSDPLMAKGVYRVPPTSPVIFAAQDAALPLHPYLLGGRLGQIRFSLSLDRAIPPPYLLASIADRWALLRGLFDVGGSRASASGHPIQFRTSSAQLCEDMAWLLRSLGGVCTVSRSCITWFVDEDLSRQVIAINPAGTAECRCITVSNADGLYLTNDFIVTHNSAIAQQVAEQISRNDNHVLVCSPEMSGDQVAERLLAQTSGIPLASLRRAEFPGDLAERESVFDRLMQLAGDIPPTLYVYDAASMKSSDVEAIARRVALKCPLGLVIIDHLHYLDDEPAHPRENRNDVVGRIARRMKQLARALNVPVLLLAQLNRANEARKDKTPVLSDLRDSGSVEQDADVVMFIHRPEYYVSTEMPGVAQIVIAKNRNGPTGVVPLGWDRLTTKFGALPPGYGG